MEKIQTKKIDKALKVVKVDFDLTYRNEYFWILKDISSSLKIIWEALKWIKFLFLLYLIWLFISFFIQFILPIIISFSFFSSISSSVPTSTQKVQLWHK